MRPKAKGKGWSRPNIRRDEEAAAAAAVRLVRERWLPVLEAGLADWHERAKRGEDPDLSEGVFMMNEARRLRRALALPALRDAALVREKTRLRVQRHRARRREALALGTQAR